MIVLLKSISDGLVLLTGNNTPLKNVTKLLHCFAKVVFKTNQSSRPDLRGARLCNSENLSDLLKVKLLVEVQADDNEKVGPDIPSALLIALGIDSILL